MIELESTYLDSSKIHSEQVISSTKLRNTLTNTLKTFFQTNDRTFVTPPQPTLNPKTLLTTLQINPQLYQASMSRQFAADFPPDIEHTTLKDEPKDWYIKTADFGDDCDRILQHRDGEYSPLLEDITGYHHLLQQDNCDRLIVLQSHEYSGYKPQITAAMQCIGYSPEQFHFIPIQPLKLYAFHRDNNKVHPIPDLPLGELQKVVNPQTLRWYSLRVPLEEIAPLNLSTSSPEHPQNHFYRIQLAYAYTQKYLTLLKSHNLDSENASETTSTNPEEQNLIDTLQSTEKILDRAINEVAPHLICKHVEQISEQFLEWLPPKPWSPSSYTTLQKVQDILLDLIESKLGLTLIPLPDKNI